MAPSRYPGGPFGSTSASGTCHGDVRLGDGGPGDGNACGYDCVGGPSHLPATPTRTATVAGPGGSGPATKRYVDAKITISPRRHQSR